MILLLALISAAGVLFLVFKFGNLRRVLWFDKYIDLISTVGLAIAFMGTMGGMAIAVIAGTFKHNPMAYEKSYRMRRINGKRLERR